MRALAVNMDEGILAGVLLKNHRPDFYGYDLLRACGGWQSVGTTGAALVPLRPVRSVSGPQPGRTEWIPGAMVFTGKERDSETGLDYFLARYMSPAQGRFTSPDEPLIDQSPGDPQSWNLYGYVRNNPLRLIDPTGLCSQDSNGSFVDSDQGGTFQFSGACVQGNTATEPRGSFVDYLGAQWDRFWTYTPIRYQNDVPLNPPAQELFQRTREEGGCVSRGLLRWDFGQRRSRERSCCGWDRLQFK